MPVKDFEYFRAFVHEKHEERFNRAKRIALEVQKATYGSNERYMVNLNCYLMLRILEDYHNWMYMNEEQWAAYKERMFL